LDLEKAKGTYSCPITGFEIIVILKSKSRQEFLSSATPQEGDDQSLDEQFEEHWSYNIAGAKGSGSYPTIDDMCEGYLSELNTEEEAYDPDTNSGIINPGAVDLRGAYSSFFKKEAQDLILKDINNILSMDRKDLPMLLKDESSVVRALVDARLKGDI